MRWHGDNRQPVRAEFGHDFSAAMGQQVAPQVVCCQPDNYEKSRRAEMTFFDDGADVEGMPIMRGCRPEDEAFCRPDDDYGCCRGREEPTDLIGSGSPLETLSYSPVRYDVNSTIDVERSHSRYSKIVVHSTRARTQRRSKAWEEWLRAATSGRSVTLLMGFSEGSRSGRGTKEASDNLGKVPALYYLDRALTKLSILPPEDNESDESGVQPIHVLVENIQVICPLTDYMMLSDEVEAQLDESERARAAMLQFKTEKGEGSEQRRICFLEESETAKDRFVQALTALWLEKRSDHSMWF